MANGDDPLPEDRAYLQALERITLRGFENSFYQYGMGLFAEEEYEADRAVLEMALRGPLCREFWAQNRQQFSVGFRQVVDSLLENDR